MVLSNVITVCLVAAMLSIAVLPPASGLTNPQILIPEDLQEDYAINWKIGQYLKEYEESMKEEKDANEKKQQETIYKLILQAWIHTFNPTSLIKPAGGATLTSLENEIIEDLKKVTNKEEATDSIVGALSYLGEEITGIENALIEITKIAEHYKEEYAFKSMLRNLYMQSYLIDFVPEKVKENSGKPHMDIEFTFNDGDKLDFSIPMTKDAVKEMLKEDMEALSGEGDSNDDNGVDTPEENTK